MAPSTGEDTRCLGFLCLNVMREYPQCDAQRLYSSAEVENEAMELELDLHDKQSELATLTMQAQQMQEGKNDVVLPTCGQTQDP